jgi:DMSO/TMAO reductase YedYZ molybdopterin-dependent catalytic subunit
VTLDKSSAARIFRAAMAGVLAGGVALGIAQLVAGLTGSTSSPVVAVGELSIDFTPPAVKDFAITAFGSHDKLALVTGILVILAIFAAAIGVLAARRLAWGMIGLGVFVLVGIIAALTRPNSSGGDALPTLVGGIVAAFALRRLTAVAAEAVPAAPARPAAGTADPAQLPQAGPADAPDTGASPAAGPAAGDRPPAAGRPATADEWRPWRPGSGTPASRPSAGQAPRAVGLPPIPDPHPRRSFIGNSLLVAGAAAIAGYGGDLLSERGSVAAARRTLRIPRATVPAPPLPAGSDLRIPGLSSFITPNSAFYRVDTAIVLPEVAPSTWQLRIHGMVAKEITLNFEELIKRPLIEDYVTLTCVSNPVAGPYVGNAKWLGASVRALLQQAGIKSGATQLLCTSTDGFTSGTPVDVTMDGRDSMLAVAMNGTVLPVEHGFPVRMVVPGLYGYVSACKWITDIEVTTFENATAYWADRGWDPQAPIKTESRIDVPSGNNELKSGKQTIAGVAWAQHKGIEAVEVRIDRGAWRPARLAAVPDLDTWRQWVYDGWDATPGVHLIEARATDKTGYTQTSLQEQPEPNGASGYPAVQVQVS